MDSAVGSIGAIIVDHLQPTLQAAASKLNELHSLAKCKRHFEPLGLQVLGILDSSWCFLDSMHELMHELSMTHIDCSHWLAAVCLQQNCSTQQCEARKDLLFPYNVCIWYDTFSIYGCSKKAYTHKASP